MEELTQLLNQARDGNEDAAERLMRLVYGELRHMAAGRMAREAPGQTLQPTALVHEAWLRLGGDRQPAWENRGHFFGAAAEAMRRILIDRARRKRAVRHGGGQARVDSATALEALATPRDEQILAVDEALARFAEIEPRLAQLVKLRYFGGLSHEETAATLGVSVSTAKRWWTYARAWLQAEISRR